VAGSGFHVRIEGLDDVAALTRDLRKMGEKDLPKAMREAGKRIGEPAGELIKQAAIDTLPAKGGLNEWVGARIKSTTLVRLAGKNVGITIKTKHKGQRGLSDLGALNRGKARHPLFGNKDHWYLTEVTAGFVGKALEPMADTAEQEFLAAVQEIIDAYVAGG
jgi:hypothetical protein